MADLVPEPGLVIPYVYLWRHQHARGEESGRKVRPSVIVVAVTMAVTGKLRVVVAPITTQPPDKSRSAVELPKRIKAHLRLTAPRSWIICDEYNEFDWPGVDLETTPSGSPTYGFVPDALVEQVRSEMLNARRRGVLKAVQRSG